MRSQLEIKFWLVTKVNQNQVKRQLNHSNQVSKHLRKMKISDIFHIQISFPPQGVIIWDVVGMMLQKNDRNDPVSLEKKRFSIS